jgi:hypothetical protein
VKRKTEMKTSRASDNKQSKQGNTHKPKPEIRDDLDSRKTGEKGNQRNKSRKAKS